MLAFAIHPSSEIAARRRRPADARGPFRK